MFAAALILSCLAPPVHDGDSLRCQGERVRLVGIDAPEMAESPRCKDARRFRSDCDPGRAAASRDFLRALTRGEVRCTVTGRDAYGRALARCVSDGVDLNRAMLRAGMARRYR
ncbi:thermonuclease family protein [Sphingosinicella sp.]|uniref:thermonuclease family protein n=1 Tax=Sphingosinicella sp. TaxID=1917971 RepID=UPI0035B15282